MQIMDTTLINENNRFVGKLDSIQLLRAITALLIFFYHIDYICNFKLFDFGRGVHLFFVISGFVIMYSTQKETNKHFIKKRMLRLLPLYWLLTVLSFVALKILPGLIRGDSSTKALICSLLFIPFERASQRHEAVALPIVGPGWTLYFEMVFSVIFGISMKISHKYRGVITSVICAVLVLIGLVPFKNVILNFYTRLYWLDFILGIVSFYILKKIYNMNFSPVRKIAALIFSVCFLLTGYIISSEIIILNEILQSCLFAAVFVLFCISLKDVSIPKQFVHIGDMSYSFYLLHYFVIIVAGKLVNLSVLSAKSMIATALALALSLLAAHISYFIIEVWFTKLVKNRFNW